MDVSIKRIDKSLPLPEYKTKGAAGFDLYARNTMNVPPQGWALIPSNLIVKIPENHGLVISARSSLAKNYRGLFLANGIGLIDSDYCGPNDEILISLYNFTNNTITVKRGDRIAQAFVVHIPKCNLQEFEEIADGSRGGFGSTGLN